MKFKSDIEVQAGLKDYSGSNGTAGQVLSTDGANVSWINQNEIAHTVSNRVKAGVAINKGQAVYVTGADGTNIIVGLASNAAEATSSKTLGLLDATVSANGFANVVEIGRLSGLNTIGANAGDPVWLGVNGNLIYGLTNKPYAPAHLVFIGIVTRVNANNGEIFVNVQNGFELKEIHDVDIVTNVPINGDVLGYDGTLWVNKTIAEWLGYTPANASGTTNYVAKFTGSTTLGDSQIFDNGTDVGIGTTSPTNKLHVANSNYCFTEVQAIGYGSTYFGSSGSNSVIYNTSGMNFYLDSSVDTIFRTNGSNERMRITSDGNIGIGTTTPTAKFMTIANMAGWSGWIENQDTTGNGSGLVVRGGSNAGGFTMLLQKQDATSTFAVTGGGNVGIGTTSPTFPFGSGLQIQNSTAAYLRLTYTGNTGFDLFQSGLDSYIYNRDNGFISLGTNNTERMRITSDGNVGIGTGSPLLTNTGRGNLTINGASDSILTLGINGVYSGYVYSSASVFELSSNAQPMTFVTNGNERMRIASSGNVGIGTTSPDSRFQIGSLYRVSSDAVTTWGVTGGSGILSWDAGLAIIGGLGSTAVQFRANNAEVMRLTTSGNVGIGTSAPEVKVDVYGTGTVQSRVQSASGGDIRFSVDTVGRFGTYSASDLLLLTSGSERMRITSSGNVGIGATSPQSCALLELKSTTRGFLPPVMTESDRDNIANPVTGLMVYTTDNGNVEVFDSNYGWRRLAWQ